MKRSILLWAGFWAVSGLSLPAQEAFKDSPYYPLKVGSQWTYQAGEKKVLLRVARVGEKVGDTACAVLEQRRDGLTISEHVAVKEDGLYRLKAMTLVMDPPMCFLKVPPKGEKTWKFDGKIGPIPMKASFTQTQAEVAVPAGKYMALMVTGEIHQEKNKLEITSYYAKGVGLVKQVQKFAGKELILQLEKYEEGK